MPFRRYSGEAGGGDFTLKVSVDSGRLRRPGGVGAHRQGQEGDKTPNMVSCPLLTPPHLPLDATPSGRASKCEGLTGTFGAPKLHP